METSHTAILDTTARNNRCTVRDRVRKSKECFIVPDALCEQNLGVVFKSTSHTKFHATAGRTVDEHRRKSQTTRTFELKIEGSGYDFAAEAAFAHSQQTNTLKSFKEASTQDFSDLTYIQSSHQLHIQTPIPTDALVHKWKLLSELGIKKRPKTDPPADPYHKYFDQMGTHYFLSASVGGKMTMVFSTLSTTKDSSESDAQKRSDCISAKASGSYAGVSASVQAAYCDKAYTEDVSNKSAHSLVRDYEIVCEGGDATMCPPDMEQNRHKFEEWKKSIAWNPVLLNGQKMWIPDLIETVLERADRTDGDAKTYKDILTKFGGPDYNISRSKLEEFRQILYNQLNLYLVINRFCQIEENKQAFCNETGRIPLEPHILHANAIFQEGEWGGWDMCPEGRFAQSVRDYRIPNKRGGNGGTVQKIELGCSRPGSAAVSSFVTSTSWPSGQLRSVESCTDNLVGFGVVHDKWGATEDIVGIERVDAWCGEHKNAPGNPGDKRLQFRTARCPNGHRVCGIRTKFNSKPLDEDTKADPGVYDFDMKCCPLPGM